MAQEQGMRVTTHNARRHKNGQVFSAKHNDRNFDVEHADNIDAERSKDNVYIMYMQDCYEGQAETFKEHERMVYETYFRECLDARNAKQLKNRHPNLVWSMEQFMKGKNTAPEECVYQIGCKGNTVDRETAITVFNEFLSWYQETYPNAPIMDAAMHFDETTPHLQFRRFYYYEDENGMCIEHQGKALQAMGIEKRFENKKEGRYNNAKEVFTAQCREKMFEICAEYGLEIIEKPKETSKTGKELIQMQADKEQERLERLKAEQQAVIDSISELTEKALKTIKPEKTKLLFGKTGNMVMNAETYQTVMQAAETITAAARSIQENAKTTAEDRAAAEQERQQAELSHRRMQEEIDRQVQEQLASLHQSELEDAEKARQDREDAARILKKQKQIIAAEVRRQTSDGQAKRMIEYYSKRKLEDGRNAYAAYQSDVQAARQKQINSDIEKLHGTYSEQPEEQNNYNFN